MPLPRVCQCAARRSTDGARREGGSAGTGDRKGSQGGKAGVRAQLALHTGQQSREEMGVAAWV